MSKFGRLSFAAAAALLAGVALQFTGCGGSTPTADNNDPSTDTKKDDVTPADTTPPTQPPSVAGSALSSIKTPAGGPEVLVTFLQDLAQRKPEGQSHPEILASFEEIQTARIEAADKLLASPTATPEQRELAVTTRIASMQMMVDAGKPTYLQEMRVYCEKVQHDENPTIAETGRMFVYGMKVGDLADGDTSQVDSLITEMNQMLAGEKNQQLMQLGQALVTGLVQQKQSDKAAQVLEMLGNAYSTHENAQFAAAGKEMAAQADLITLGIPEQFDAVMQGDDPQAAAALHASLTKAMQAREPGSVLLQLTARFGRYMEETQNYQQASNAYELIAQGYAKSTNPELKQMADKTVENGRKRVSLIGRPFVVNGVKADGTPFDWSQYRGKVVLVDFWATWCGPCVQELPHIQKAYENYHDRGLEVVGVNLDHQPQALQNFFKYNTLPWTTVVSEDPNAMGFNNPLAVACGVETIPFVVLVNGEGIVVALHARGSTLEEKLTQLLGPAGSTTGEGAATAATPGTTLQQ